MLFGVAALVAVLAMASVSCLPSVQFDSGGHDGGPDAAATDSATPPTPEGGRDAPVDVTTDATTPVDGGVADGPPDVALGPIANSTYHGYEQTAACAVHDGTLYCWGDVGSNATGQLGFPSESAGDDAGILDPTAVTTTAEPASQIVELVMSTYSTCALYGTAAYCWGGQQGGQLGTLDDADGGPTEFPVVGAPAGGFTSMAATALGMCALSTPVDAGNVSNVYCWGYNGSGELGRPIAAGGAGTAVPVTGDVDGGPLGVIPDAIQIAAGGYHVCAITSTHSILCWGNTDFYQSGPTLGPTNCPGGDAVTCSAQPLPVTLPAGETAVELALGWYHSCVLTEAGNVYCWGLNDSGELATASPGQTCTYDMNPVGCSGTPVKIPVSKIQHLYAGGFTSCALDSSRHAYCWGNNEDGELGQGSDSPILGPVELLDGVTANPCTFDDMAMGSFSVCARDGTQLYCWGSGVLGTWVDGGMPNPYYPALVQF